MRSRGPQRGKQCRRRQKISNTDTRAFPSKKTPPSPPQPPPPNSQLPPPPRSRRAGTMLEVFHSASQSFTHSLRLAAITLRGAACSSGAHQQPPPWEEIIQGDAAPGFWTNAKCKGKKKQKYPSKKQYFEVSHRTIGVPWLRLSG